MYLACGDIFNMWACIWHAVIYFGMWVFICHAGIYLEMWDYFECINFACKHVVFGGHILGMCMCLICGHLFDMSTSI